MASALELIANEIRHCHSCPLHKSRHRAVPGVGPASADILLLGEGPGQKEDQTGLPFCGPAGSFLGELISSLGVDRRRLFVTNTVRCQPPNNRDPMLAEIAACSTWTQAQIDILNPKLIVTLGRFAAETYFHGLPMKQVHGCLTRTDGILVFGSYHPAAALHQPALRDQIKADFRLLGEVIRKL